MKASKVLKGENMKFNIAEYNILLRLDQDKYEYANANIIINGRSFHECNTLVYIPSKPAMSIHSYLFIDNYKIYNYLVGITHKVQIGLEILLPDGKILNMRNVMIDEGKFSQKGYLLIHFPKFTFWYYKDNLVNECNKFTFKISDSELLKTNPENHFPEYKIEINNIENLGIRLLKTDDKIENNILHIEFYETINSYYSMIQKVKPVIELVLYLTSFTERRWLTWSSFTCGNKFEFFNTRRVFHEDKKVYRLISDHVFNGFIAKALKKIRLEDIGYYLSILNLVVTANRHPTNVKIILLNTALDTILKKRFGMKKDKYKEELINELGIIVYDIENIKDMIDIRNDITHGDKVSSRKQFKIADAWQTLLERIVLKEVGWGDLSMTDVFYNKDRVVPGLV